MYKRQACASRYVGNGVSHCGLRGVGHGVWVTICGYVTVRYGALRLCVTVRYGALRVCNGQLCQSMFKVRVTFSYDNWKKNPSC